MPLISILSQPEEITELSPTYDFSILPNLSFSIFYTIFIVFKRKKQRNIDLICNLWYKLLQILNLGGHKK